MRRLRRLVTAGVLLAGAVGVMPMGDLSGNHASAAAQITLKVNKPFECCLKSTTDLYKLFQQRHPNVTLQQVNVNPSDTSSLTASLLAGTAPDLIAVDPGQAKTYYKSGYLLPMNKYYQKYGWTKRYFRAERNSMLVGNTYIGTPFDYEGIILVYNATMFKQNGWTVPKDYNQLLALSAKIASKGIMPIGWGDSDCQACNEFWISSIVNTVLGPRGAARLYSGSVPWTDKRVEAGLQRFVDYYQKGYVTQKKSFAVSGSGATRLFLSGRAAMQLNGTWVLGTAGGTQKPTFSVGYALFPSWKPGGKPVVPMGTGGGLEINKKSKYPDLVADLINGYLNPKVMQDMIQEGGPVPVTANLKKIKGISPNVKGALRLLARAQTTGQAGYVDYAWASPTVITKMETEGSTLYLKKMSVHVWAQMMEKAKEKDRKAGTLIPLSNFG